MPTNQENQDTFILISSERLRIIEEKIDKIYQSVNNSDPKQSGINGYITEPEAQKMFKKSHTWFWERRKNGEIPFKKAGKTVYYSVEDLNKFFTNS